LRRIAQLFDEKERSKGPKSAFPQQSSPESDTLLGPGLALPMAHSALIATDVQAKSTRTHVFLHEADRCPFVP